MRKVSVIAMLGATSMSLLSCNGILEGIYDQPQTKTDGYGFISVNEADNSGTVYVNTADYARWTYIDFHNLTTDTVNIITEGNREPEHWDIAIHRYDAKTNGAEVIETGFTGFDILRASGKLPEGQYIADEWTTDRIAVDMSGMMEGNIRYAESYYNAELSKWLNVNTSTMPPVYTLSRKVYVAKLKDGTALALKLSDYTDAAGNKGYMTVEYVYPLDF